MRTTMLLAGSCRDLGLHCIWLQPVFPQPDMPLTAELPLPTESANEADIGPRAA